jgi:uncharacterized protein Yka (UPF0111/DUF47 family)
MTLLRRRVTDTGVFDLLDEAGRNVQITAQLLRDLVTDYPERADLAHELYLREQEGDRIAHDVIYLLTASRTPRAGRPPLASADGHALATALDDIVDYAEETADRLGLYGVEAPMEQAVALADVLVSAADQVATALRALRDGGNLAPTLVEIHRLENEGDRISREAVASLFADGIDPMVVIRWKDVYDSLESAVDACEHVAHILEGIALKRGA